MNVRGGFVRTNICVAKSCVHNKIRIGRTSKEVQDDILQNRRKMR